MWACSAFAAAGLVLGFCRLQNTGSCFREGVSRFADQELFLSCLFIKEKEKFFFFVARKIPDNSICLFGRQVRNLFTNYCCANPGSHCCCFSTERLCFIYLIYFILFLYYYYFKTHTKVYSITATDDILIFFQSKYVLTRHVNRPPKLKKNIKKKKNPKECRLLQIVIGAFRLRDKMMMCRPRPFKIYLALKTSLTTAADDTNSFIYLFLFIFFFSEKKVFTFYVNRLLQVSLFCILRVNGKMMVFSLFKIYLTFKAPILTAADDTLFFICQKKSLIFHVNNLIRGIFI